MVRDGGKRTTQKPTGSSDRSHCQTSGPTSPTGPGPSGRPYSSSWQDDFKHKLKTRRNQSGPRAAPPADSDLVPSQAGHTPGPQPVSARPSFPGTPLGPSFSPSRRAGWRASLQTHQCHDVVCQVSGKVWGDEAGQTRQCNTCVVLARAAQVLESDRERAMARMPWAAHPTPGSPGAAGAKSSQDAPGLGISPWVTRHIPLGCSCALSPLLQRGLELNSDEEEQFRAHGRHCHQERSRDGRGWGH